uniref:F-box domain-containing protein n=1 Tax=Leersia perrieri TaxID=77586 RepID=A0A0D9WIT4_9ORYZ
MIRDRKRGKSTPSREPPEMKEDVVPSSKKTKFVPSTEGAMLPDEILTDVLLPNLKSVAVYKCSPSKPIDDLLFTLDDVRGNHVEVAPAPCHGLTLLYNAVAPAYYVFNADTRAVTRLPPCQDVTHATAGLGFDTRKKEYKVVRLFQAFLHDMLSLRCEVFTLGGEEGDQWRPAAGGVPFRFCRFARSAICNAAENKLQPVFVNGFLHWLINPIHFHKIPRAAVISFSLTDETFRWIRSPPFEVSKVHLVELDDQLCMVRDLRNGLPTGSMFEIWRLDYNSGDWSLDHQIDLTGNLQRDLIEPRTVKVIGSIGSCRSGKKIIIATSKHNVCAYDPVCRTLETIISITETCTAYQNEKSDIRFSLFRESLATVHKTREEIGFSTPLSKATQEILLRLPAETIFNLKLVCKQWLRLIKSERFVHAFFDHKNMDRRPKIMLVGKGSENSVFDFIPSSKWLQEAGLGTLFLDKKVVCSKPCHGLNLVSVEEKDYLFNPCTGYHKIYGNREHQLHQLLSLSVDRCEEDNPFAVGNKNVGLGFCQVTQSHAVVGIFYSWKNYKSRQYNLRCFMWSCAERGSPLLDPPLPVNDMPPVSLDGVLYWMSEPRLGWSYEWAIVSFDVTARTFDVIPCPSCIAMWHSGSPCHAFVVELQGMLCTVLSNSVADELDIWQWDHGLWNRAYTINLKFWPDYSLATNVVVPLTVDPTDGRVLLNTGRKLGLYDPCEQTIENLLALDQASQQQHPWIARCENDPRKFTEWKPSLAPCDKFANPSSASSGRNRFNSRDQSKELNSASQKIMPVVPMLYEESLACYPRTAKMRLLFG